MDDKAAALLLVSLLERIERDPIIGTASSVERQALQRAVKALSGVGKLASSPEPEPPLTKPSILPTVQLVQTAIERDSPSDPEVLLCLDFGTAMSKAFACVNRDEFLDLELGAAAGGKGYTLPSSVFIGDDGKAYFGFEAIDLSLELVDTGRERLDSIKGWLSLRREGNLDGEACMLADSLNPTTYRLTQGDLIRAYLAYLTDMAGCALADFHPKGRSIGRYIKRRFARPCWPDVAQAQWADHLMRTLLAEAQILADTFSGRWAGGIDVAELKGAIEQVKKLGRRPDYLIDIGVPEPVAVAAGAIAESENLRDGFMVVDVGAGTTDFGFFVSAHSPNDYETRVYQVSGSVQGLMQAGDKVDGMLRTFISRKESIDTSDSAGRLILADLGRRIRSLKEVLFKTGRLEYALADGTVGLINLEEFLSDTTVQRFGALVEEGFKKSLQAVDESYLRWLAMDGVRLHVVLTGGSSQLPMMRALSRGVIEVKGYRLMREAVDPRPGWMRDMPEELQEVYPQLAVAIGGSADEIPESLSAPMVFGGGSGRTTYVAGQLHVSGA